MKYCTFNFKVTIPFKLAGRAFKWRGRSCFGFWWFKLKANFNQFAIKNRSRDTPTAILQGSNNYFLSKISGSWKPGPAPCRWCLKYKIKLLQVRSGFHTLRLKCGQEEETFRVLHLTSRMRMFVPPPSVPSQSISFFFIIWWTLGNPGCSCILICWTVTGPCGNTNMPDYAIDYSAIFRHESSRLLLSSAGLNLQFAAVQRVTDILWHKYLNPLEKSVEKY